MKKVKVETGELVFVELSEAIAYAVARKQDPKIYRLFEGLGSYLYEFAPEGSNIRESAGIDEFETLDWFRIDGLEFVEIRVYDCRGTYWTQKIDLD